MAPHAEHSAERIDPHELDSFTRGYFAAWNSYDPMAVAAHATDDVVWDSPALHEPGHGRAAVAALVASTATAFPDYEFSQPEPVALAADHLTAYVPWRMTGTNTGPFDPPGYAPTGRSVDLPGIDVWRLRDGLIWRYRAVYNYSLVARQMGLGMPRGGRLEQLAVRAQRLFVRVPRGGR